MSFIETKYVTLLSSRLDKFARKKDGLWNFRCPYCGDSQKHKNKARGYFYYKRSDVVFKCHNCGVGRSLANFLKDHAMDLHDEYVMERYKEGLTGKGRNTPEPKFEFKKPKFVSKPTGLTKITDLNNSHPAVRYLKQRQIPEDKLKDLYYVERWQQWVNSQKQTYSQSSMRYHHPRIVIPLIAPNGEWFGFQGRSLDKNDKMRYVTIMLDEEQPKIYGLDKLDATRRIYITEGPFDSTFIRNACAMCGSDVHLDSGTYSDIVYIYDNEPRNKQICDRIAKAIADGEQVVIWPKDIEEKDINDMVLSGHDVQNLVESNVYTGLQATLKLNDWKRV